MYSLKKVGNKNNAACSRKVTMNQNFISLEELQIAKPCRADWNRMTGDERARFCLSCHKNVYDISQMTREEAQKLIAQNEGHVCVRLYRRPDGTVITSDCPVGKREVMRPMWWTLAGFVALMASGVAVWSAPTAKNPKKTTLKTPLVDRARRLPLAGALVNKVAPPRPVLMGDIAPTVMGRIAVPKPAATPTMGKPTMGALLPPARKPGK